MDEHKEKLAKLTKAEQFKIIKNPYKLLFEPIMKASIKINKKMDELFSLELDNKIAQI